MRSLTLLGASGSIGTSTLQVLRLHRDKFKLHGIAALHDYKKLFTIIEEFRPKRVAVFDSHSAQQLKAMLKDAQLDTEVLDGELGVIELSGDGEASVVIDAIVGAAGLKPVLAAVKTGCVIGLANKEALVMSGQLFFDEVKKYHASVLPIDSEHSAIFQCLPELVQQNLGFCDLESAGVQTILLTGSGGPFRTTPSFELSKVTAQMAIAHPVWSMGPKISVDSATMMNKGLEFIEARYLFNAQARQIQVLIHPQSAVHSMVAFKDGAIMAQLGTPDMRTPIARALAYPERIDSGVSLMDFARVGSFSFEDPDFKRYPCLKLAIEASAQGQGATTMLNAANEEAVAAFLDGKIGYLDIARVCNEVLNTQRLGNIYTLEEILEIDSQARLLAKQAIGKLNAL